jgi:hypothetical protein
VETMSAVCTLSDVRSLIVVYDRRHVLRASHGGAGGGPANGGSSATMLVKADRHVEEPANGQCDPGSNARLVEAVAQEVACVEGDEQPPRAMGGAQGTSMAGTARSAGRSG